MRISISLATYNGEKYLQEQLDSIYYQSRQPDELIICDDGSTDLTVDILEKFKINSPFFCQIHKNKKNKGTGYTFKKAIDLCSGDIIVFCDQDDVWESSKLDRIEKAFIESPEIDFVISNANIINQDSKDLGYSLWEQRGFTEYWRTQFKKGNQFNVLFTRNIVTGMTTAISKRLRIFGYDKPVNIYHDAWYLYIATISGMKGELINEKLINYRQHINQQYGSIKTNKWNNFKNLKKSKKQSINNNIKVLEPLLEFAKYNLTDSNDSKLVFLKKKLNHLKVRKSMNDFSFYIRFVKIIQESIKGNYIKFGSLKSILIDLF